MTTAEIPIFYQWATQSDSAPFWYGELQGDRVPTYQEFLEEWKSYYFSGSKPEKGRCLVILVEGKAIGQVNYNEINREDNSVELDIIIAEEANKGKGYGPDALGALSEYLFCEMKIQTCWIEVIDKNPRAVRAYRKTGFEPTRTFVDSGIECIHMELRNKKEKMD